MSKVYVDENTHFGTEGNVVPSSIVWEDGTEYVIDRVLNMRKAASLKAGGMRLRYTVRLQNEEQYLFFEKGTVIVEGK